MEIHPNLTGNEQFITVTDYKIEETESQNGSKLLTARLLQIHNRKNQIKENLPTNLPTIDNVMIKPTNIYFHVGRISVEMCQQLQKFINFTHVEFVWITPENMETIELIIEATKNVELMSIDGMDKRNHFYNLKEINRIMTALAKREHLQEIILRDFDLPFKTLSIIKKKFEKWNRLTIDMEQCGLEYTIEQLYTTLKDRNIRLRFTSPRLLSEKINHFFKKKRELPLNYDFNESPNDRKDGILTIRHNYTRTLVFFPKDQENIF